MDDRTAEIVDAARAIFTAVEEGTTPLSRVALRARRLAQLIDDDENFMWLQLECQGAMSGAKPVRKLKDRDAAFRGVDKFMKLREAVDYSKIKLADLTQAVAEGKVIERTRAMGMPLAILEVEKVSFSKEDEAALARELGGADTLLTASLMERDRKTALERVAGAIHEWASNVYVAHRFRQLAGNIFERFKTGADAALSKLCPGAIAKLTHAVERSSSENPEDWSAAALACRRVLKEFADAVYAPVDGEVDGHVVDDARYKNRLWAFAKKHGRRALDSQFLAAEELEGICAALDKVNEHDSKGVHASITRQEAEMLVLRTYILLVQLSQLALGAGAGEADAAAVTDA